MTKPLLSIGIIFKNEIRCLERCLKSLQPLRDAIPCELVMADTGATDGSREVAEKYADILFDFPWVNDFAAARNAVIDHCSGKWYMTIDCDEWVDGDIGGFTRFLTTNREFNFAAVVIRNYDTADLSSNGTYSDFLAVRLARISAGAHYEGAIHEHWFYRGEMKSMVITNGVFHHDGYVYQDAAKQLEKQKRNMKLLREQLEHDPDNLIVLTQCVESSANMPEQEEYLRRALAGVNEKRSQWQLFGAPVYRHAVRMAMRDHLPELEEWIKQAETLFPKSIFVRVEIAYFAFGHYWAVDDYHQAILWGERYLQGVEDYYAGRFDRTDLLASSLDKTDSHSKLNVATVLASGYLHEKQPEKCVRLMETFDGREMNGKQAGDCVRNLCNLRASFGVDTDTLLQRLWDEINELVPNQERAMQRRAAFLEVGEGMLEGVFIRAEPSSKDFIFHAYTTFLPLAGKCELGDAAVMLETEDSAVLEKLLHGIGDLSKLPVQALYHAIDRGVPFPDRPMKIEQIDLLTRRMTQDKKSLLDLAVRSGKQLKNRQATIWARGLILAALTVFDWKNETADIAMGMSLAHTFAEIETVFLPLCYAPDTLREENLNILPPMHRFGWYLIRAFETLDTGDAAGYVRLLRSGLETNEGAKSMVEFLTKHTPELQAPPPSAEMIVLAEQIRTVLAGFAPDDPAVATLKQSEAYQKVAYLIEGLEPPVMGGQLQ